MLDLSPDITPPQPVRLADYRPPDFLIDTVDLVFELGADDTRVKSRLGVRRNPAAGAARAPLRLDGEALELISLALDGEKLGANRYQLPEEGGLILDDLPDTFTLEVETRIAPESNTELSGLYMSGGNFCTQCEAEGFRRITYFLDRPDVMARYTTTVTADKAQFPVLLSNGNPEGAGDADNGRHWAKWVDPHPKPSYLFALVAGDLVAVEGPVHDAVGPRGSARHLGTKRRRGQMRSCDGLAEKGDGLGRRGVRSRIRSRRLQHRRGQRLQHGGDGKQEPQHLQHPLRAGQARDRDRHRLPEYRGGDRP